MILLNLGTVTHGLGFPPAPALMVPGREDMEYDPGGEGDELPDGLHSGDGLLSLWECIRPGTHA